MNLNPTRLQREGKFLPSWSGLRLALEHLLGNPQVLDTKTPSWFVPRTVRHCIKAPKDSQMLDYSRYVANNCESHYFPTSSTLLSCWTICDFKSLFVCSNILITCAIPSCLCSYFDHLSCLLKLTTC